ncbi:hypothetical protein [Candidatus Poriferisodalis sp.]|uniref:hypothetical protein n=1 Tax=Candidatus Poriferisodalis sp. TaxID=3101277 RepID=UPI003B0228CB
MSGSFCGRSAPRLVRCFLPVIAAAIVLGACSAPVTDTEQSSVPTARTEVSGTDADAEPRTDSAPIKAAPPETVATHPTAAVGPSNPDTAPDGAGDRDAADSADHTPAESDPADESAPGAEPASDPDSEPTEPGAGEDPDGTAAEPDDDGEPRTPEPDEFPSEPNTTATYVRETEASVLVGGHGSTETTVHLPSGLWTAHLYVRNNAGEVVMVLGSHNSECQNWPRGITLIDDVITDGDRGFAVRPFRIGHERADWCRPGPFSFEVTATGQWSVVFEHYSEQIVERDAVDDSGTILTIEGHDATQLPLTLASGSWTAAFSSVDGESSADLAYVGPHYSDLPECQNGAEDRVAGGLSGELSPRSTATLTISPPDHEWCEVIVFTLRVSASGDWTLELREGTGEARKDADNKLMIAESDGSVTVTGSGPVGTPVDLSAGSWIAESSVTGNDGKAFRVVLHGAAIYCGHQPRLVTLADLRGDSTSGNSTLPVLIGESEDALCEPGTFILGVDAFGDWKVVFTDVSDPSDADDRATVGGIELRPVRRHAKTGPEPQDPTFTQISVGDRYACGVTLDHEIECWGSNNTWGHASAPSGKYLQVAAGDNHTCALTVQSTVHCWGDGYYGQTASPDGEFIQVMTADGISCALRADGSFACWGSLGGYSLGDVESPPDLRLSSLGEGSLCGLRDDQTMACWYFARGESYNDPREIRLTESLPGRFAHVGSRCGTRTDGSVACWYASPPDPASPPGGGEFVQTSDLCGITADGHIECWGSGQYGYANRPALAPAGRFIQISSGGFHACALRTDGKARCWGNGYGDGPQPPSTGFAQVSVGSTHPCGITVKGAVECWDREYLGISLSVEGWRPPDPGALPEGSFSHVSVGGFREASSVACAVGAGGRLACWDYYGDMTVPDGEFTDVSVGRGQTCAVHSSGKAECWAWSSDDTVPPPSDDQRFSSVSATIGYACGVRTDGTLACWGSSEAWPDDPPSGTFTEVSVGWYRACAVTTANRLECWTWRSEILETTKLRTPADPPSGSFTAVSVSTYYACALRTDGTVTCWGSGTIGRARPPGGRITQISAGPDYACGVRSDGSVRCWG